MRIHKKNNKNELRYEIGGIGLAFNVKHHGIREKLRLHYKDYRSLKKPDVCIDVKYAYFQKPSIKSLLFENRSLKLAVEKGRYLLYFPGKTMPSLARFNRRLNKVKFYTMDPSGQLLMYLFPEALFSLFLPQNNAIMLHACGVLNGKKAYCFLAYSGGGKSTIAKSALKQGFKVLNDDRIIIRREKSLFKIYGNPWHGEVEKTSNKSSFIREIFFLKKAGYNQIKPISRTKAATGFLTNSFCLSVSDDTAKKKLDICSDFAENLNCYKLYFKHDKSIWRFLDGFAK